MKIIKPYYYDSFKCIASKCRDSCCVGWEIDIDRDTLKLYSEQKGELAKKLAANIKDGSFVLDKNERCPFLQKDGLCELICLKGDELLCEICREHPRYYEFYGDCCDTGLGLCCEEACRLLFASDKPVSFVCEGEGGHELIAARDRLIAKAQDRTAPFEYFDDWDRVFEFWDEFEPFDERWTAATNFIKANIQTVASAVIPFISQLGKRVFEYENLRIYLLHRHFMKLCRGYENIALGIEVYMTTQLLFDVYTYLQKGSFDLEDRIDTAKYLSKQIEYSEENTDILFW